MFSNDLRCFIWQMSSFSSDFAVGHQLILQLYMMIDTIWASYTALFLATEIFC